MNREVLEKFVNDGKLHIICCIRKRATCEQCGAGEHKDWYITVDGEIEAVCETTALIRNLANERVAMEIDKIQAIEPYNPNMRRGGR